MREDPYDVGEELAEVLGLAWRKAQSWGPDAEDIYAEVREQLLLNEPKVDYSSNTRRQRLKLRVMVVKTTLIDAYRRVVKFRERRPQFFGDATAAMARSIAAPRLEDGALNYQDGHAAIEDSACGTGQRCPETGVLFTALEYSKTDDLTLDLLLQHCRPNVRRVLKLRLAGHSDDEIREELGWGANHNAVWKYGRKLAREDLAPLLEA